MKFTTKIKLLMTAAAGGGAATYLMDPVAGPARRRRLVSALQRRSDDMRDVAESLDLIKEAVVPSESAADEPQTHGEQPPPPDVAGVTDIATAR